MSTSYSTIYADFLQHCRKAPPANPWGVFSKNSDFWWPPQDEEATLDDLRKKYGEKKLIESRLATNDTPAHRWQLNAILDMSQGRILPLRTSPNSKPFDLLTDDGTVSGQLPASAALQDHAVQQGIQKTGVLCLAFSTEDLAALRSAGIPASLAKGLEGISRKALKEFCSSLGFGEPDGLPHLSNDSPQTPPIAVPLQVGISLEEQLASAPFKTTAGSNGPVLPQPRLFLVGWAPSRLSLHRRREVDEVVRSLTEASEYLEVDLDDVFLWRPTPAEVRRIEYCLAKGQRKHLQRAIITSLRRSAELVTQVQGDVDESSSLLVTRTRLQEALLRPSTSPAERRRWLRLHRQAVDTAFVTPVLEQAADEPDPKRRSHLAGLARINQVLFPAVELYLAKRDKEVAKRGVEAWDQVSDVRDLMKMFDTLFKFTQESE